MATQRQEQLARMVVDFSVFQGDPNKLIHAMDVAKNRAKVNHIKIVVTRPESEGALIFRSLYSSRQDTAQRLVKTGSAESLSVNNPPLKGRACFGKSG